MGEPRGNKDCHTGAQRGALRSQRLGVGTGPEDGGSDGRIPRGRSGDQTRDGGAPGAGGEGGAPERLLLHPPQERHQPASPHSHNTGHLTHISTSFSA